MKLVHKDKEYQMEEVRLDDFSIVSTPNAPLKLNLEAGRELILTFFFNYEIFDPTLERQTLQQFLLSNTNATDPINVSQRQLTRVKGTFNCIFGIGHSLRPG